MSYSSRCAFRHALGNVCRHLHRPRYPTSFEPSFESSIEPSIERLIDPLNLPLTSNPRYKYMRLDTCPDLDTALGGTVHPLLDKGALDVFGCGGCEPRNEDALVHEDLCVDMCVDMRADMCADMCVDRCADLCVCLDKCLDMRIDAQRPLCMSTCDFTCVLANAHSSMARCLRAANASEFSSCGQLLWRCKRGSFCFGPNPRRRGIWRIQCIEGISRTEGAEGYGESKVPSDTGNSRRQAIREIQGARGYFVSNGTIGREVCGRDASVGTLRSGARPRRSPLATLRVACAEKKRPRSAVR